MSKESDLQALADDVRDFVDQEIPTATQWNENPGVLRDGLALVGNFFTDSDAAIAAIVARYNANHLGDGSHDLAETAPEWVPDTGAVFFISPSSFDLGGDRFADVRVGERLRVHQGTGGTTLLIVTIVSIAPYNPQNNRTTVVVRTAASLSPLSPAIPSSDFHVDRGLVRNSLPRIGSLDLLDRAIDDARLFKVNPGIIPRDALAPLCIDNTKIIDGEVISSKLPPLVITYDKMAADSVRAGVIKAREITGAAIALTTIKAEHIGAKEVTYPKLATPAVRGENIYDDTIPAGKLTALSVDEGNLRNNVVTTRTIVDGHVTPPKLPPLHYQQKGVDSVVPGVFRQCGWHFLLVPGDENTLLNRVIVFPVPFASTVLGITMQSVGFKRGSDPTTLADVPGIPTNSNAVRRSVFMLLEFRGLTLTGFTALGANNDDSLLNLNPGDRLVFYWEALGV